MQEQIPFKFDVPTVSELTLRIKQLLESNFSDVLVEGELSNVKQSRNGHYYFTVKDTDAQLPCVIWRSTAERIRAEIVDGQQVVLGGDIQVYAPHGRYQMIVSHVEQAGIGKLQQAFEKLKKKLQEEGLFDEDRKKELPLFPGKIGVVTSSTGAAFQDIRSTLERRWPLAHVYLYHASVQGVNAAPELVKGIRYFSARNDVDVVILGRGGGSLEDLWPFNEELVARSIFECPVPVISAVGHEVDFSISDFVADVRAATPTQAAVLATPDINEIRFLVDDLASELISEVTDKVQRYGETVRRLGDAHALLVVKDRIKNQKERIGSLQENLGYGFDRLASDQRELIRDFNNRIEQRINEVVSRNKEKFTGLLHRLEKRDPNDPLEKGFVRVWQDNSWVRIIENFKQTEKFELEWKNSRVEIEQN